MKVDIFKYIVAEIKEMESCGMVYLIILSVAFSVIDVGHFYFHYPYPEFIRIFYFYAFIISSTFYINRIGKRIRLNKETQKTEQIRIELFRHVSGGLFELLYEFARKGCLNIELDTQDKYDNAVTAAKVFDFIKVTGKTASIDIYTLRLLEKAFLYQV